MARDEKSQYVISYWRLRQSLGVLALIMPLWVRLGVRFWEHIPSTDSISAYYYTSMRDVFVGTLCAVGVFLFCYRGYDRIDNWVTNVAGLAAIGIGLLPMDPQYHAVLRAKYTGLGSPACYVPHGPLGFHFIVVCIFFGLISYLVTFRFTRSDEVVLPARKRARNRVYIVSGSAMATCFVIIGLLKWRAPNASIFAPETIAVVAFSLAWLTKGEALLGDRSPA
jgi:hypothetical protein